MALKLRREWVVGMVLLVLAILTVLVLAWRNAGIEPIRPLTAPAVLPGAAR